MDSKADIFLDIMESHKGIIYKIVRSYCKDQGDRDDLVQEIIIQLWQSFENYNSQFKLSTWIYRIALNTSISFYRKVIGRKHNTSELSQIIAATVKAEDPFQEDPRLALLQVFIDKLRDMDKAMILLYLDGLSQKEIAEIVGITPTNVGTKLTRIKKILQHHFQNQDHGPSAG